MGQLNKIHYSEVIKMKKSLPISLVRPQLSKLVAELEKGGDPIEITHRGRVEAVLINSEDYESLLETLEILSDPEAMNAIKESEKDIKAGRLTDLEDLKKSVKVKKRAS